MSPLQLSVYWRLSLVMFFTSFLFFLDVFTAAIVAATCHHGNGTGANSPPGTFPPNAESNQSAPGTDGEEDSVCGWTDWLSYGQALFMVGLLLGSLVGGVLSDRYGKRPVLLISVCVHAVCGLVPAILPQPLLFLAIRCVTGVCYCCSNICAFSLAVEWTPPAARLWPPAFLTFCFSLGMMGGAPLAWFSTTWWQLHLALALPQLICLPLYFFIPESPHWLLLKRKTDVLDRYRSNSPADKQGLDLLLDSAWSDLQKAIKAQKEQPPGGHAHRDILHLRRPVIMLRLLIMSSLSVASALTYYGICMNIGSFGVSVYSAHIFSGLSETPCLLVPLVRMGRRPLSMLALFLSGAACFLSLLLSSYNCEPALVMGLALMGKLCILTAMFIFTLYCIELFPTVVRQRCLALVNLCFRLGSLANSLVLPTSNGEISLAAMIVYSSGPIIGCGLCLLLPETSGIPLPDSVEDCDRQPRLRPPSISALWRRRKSERGRARRPELLAAARDDAHTPNTHTPNTHTGPV